MVTAFAVMLLHLSPVIHAVPKAAISAAATAQPNDTLPATPVPAASRPDDAIPKYSKPELVAESTTPGAQDPSALEAIRITQFPPPKPMTVFSVERPPSRKAWLLLSIADHSAAAFDAYSTRAAISRGASEGNPLLRPFAGSDGLYAAIQATPLALDFIARRMQRSQTRLLRRTWWLPQAASTALLLFAGAHNMTVLRR